MCTFIQIISIIEIIRLEQIYASHIKMQRILSKAFHVKSIPVRFQVNSDAWTTRNENKKQPKRSVMNMIPIKNKVLLIHVYWLKIGLGAIVIVSVKLTALSPQIH